jgi:hypothetical protein
MKIRTSGPTQHILAAMSASFGRAFSALFLLVGCAVAVDQETVVPVGGARGDATGDDATLDTTPDTAVDARVDARPDADASADAPAETAADAAADAPSDAPADTRPDVPPEASGPCAPVGGVECAAATELPEMDGDQGSSVETTKGTGNRFLKIKVKEGNSDLFASPAIKVRVTLTSPPGANFDLFLYRGPDFGSSSNPSHDCVTVATSSTAASGPDVASLQWPDQRANSDTRWITIEVRSADPVCPTGEWTVTVEGNKS